MADFWRRRRRLRQIREAIDTWPGGICFAYPGGMTILVNPTMNRLCHELTGETVLNAERTWELLRSDNGRGIAGVQMAGKLSWSQVDRGMAGADRDMSGVAGNMHGADRIVSGDCAVEKLPGGEPRPGQPEESSAKDTLWIRTADSKVWQFNREQLRVEEQPMYQYTAEDVTELYEYRLRLQEAIDRRRDYQERQRRLLADIARTNEQKERLQAKIRIHDDFGRCLIATRKYLQGEMIPEGSSLYEEWDYAIRGMNHLSEIHEERLPSPEAELLRVAELIGCRVIFRGKQPEERRPLLLLYAAIREALTNAVRHGGADCLTVEIRQESELSAGTTGGSRTDGSERIQGTAKGYSVTGTDRDVGGAGNMRGGYIVTISDNGTGCDGPIREGAGLSSLRTRLEQEGARMEITAEGGVKMRLWLPGEGTYGSGTDR